MLCLLPASQTSAQTTGNGDGPLPVELVDAFETHIRPLLIERCYECHSTEAGEAAGGLKLDAAAATLRGGHRGAAIVPGDADASLLIRAVSYDDADLQMPPDGKLDDASIDQLKRWIQAGAVDPRVQPAGSNDDRQSPLDLDPQSHWAYVRPVSISRQAAATFITDDRSQDVIDAAAATRAADAGVPMAPRSTPQTLLRRLSFDLTGLPPTADQIDAFVADDRPDAWTRVVDRMLASPEFAERFARHWLDVARYADTRGYGFGGVNRRLIGSERYRDWVIRAIADDMPYDQMITHQLAGDRTDPDNTQGNLDAMGFLTLGRRFINPIDTIDDQIDVVSRGLMGMTVTCARCHDHKFDPIPTSDYYALFGVFHSSTFAEVQELEKSQPPSPLRMIDRENPADHHIMVRGQQGNVGPVAVRQFVTVLRGDDDPPFRDGSGRLELATRITNVDNPLTSRVMVNRIWGILIGRPLVDSPSDFGVRTPPPRVPEVLDDLAVEFSQSWSIKRLVRRIVMTRIYQQSASDDEAALTADPDNQLLGRANRRRRDFESLRDSMLMVAGSLDRGMGGPPVEVSGVDVQPRRTVYAMIDRQNLPSMFRSFDFANPDSHSPQRYFTTVPQQALFLLNHPQIAQLAAGVIEATDRDVARTAPQGDVDSRITALVRRVWSRNPTAPELDAMRTYVASPGADDRWKQLAQVLLISNELGFID